MNRNYIEGLRISKIQTRITQCNMIVNLEYNRSMKSRIMIKRNGNYGVDFFWKYKKACNRHFFFSKQGDFFWVFDKKGTHLQDVSISSDYNHTWYH